MQQILFYTCITATIINFITHYQCIKKTLHTSKIQQLRDATALIKLINNNIIIYHVLVSKTSISSPKTLHAIQCKIISLLHFIKISSLICIHQIRWRINKSNKPTTTMQREVLNKQIRETDARKKLPQVCTSWLRNNLISFSSACIILKPKNVQLLYHSMSVKQIWWLLQTQMASVNTILHCRSQDKKHGRQCLTTCWNMAVVENPSVARHGLAIVMVHWGESQSSKVCLLSSAA